MRFSDQPEGVNEEVSIISIIGDARQFHSSLDIDSAEIGDLTEIIIFRSSKFGVEPKNIDTINDWIEKCLGNYWPQTSSIIPRYHSAITCDNGQYRMDKIKAVLTDNKYPNPPIANVESFLNEQIIYVCFGNPDVDSWLYAFFNKIEIEREEKQRKMNLAASEILTGTLLKCPSCSAVFNPGPITLLTVFGDLDNGATVRAPGYVCPSCMTTSSVENWYRSTLTIRPPVKADSKESHKAIPVKKDDEDKKRSLLSPLFQA